MVLPRYGLRFPQRQKIPIPSLGSIDELDQLAQKFIKERLNFFVDQLTGSTFSKQCWHQKGLKKSLMIRCAIFMGKRPLFQWPWLLCRIIAMSLPEGGHSLPHYWSVQRLPPKPCGQLWPGRGSRCSPRRSQEGGWRHSGQKSVALRAVHGTSQAQLLQCYSFTCFTARNLFL